MTIQILANVDLERGLRLSAPSNDLDPHAVKLWNMALSELPQNSEREKLAFALNFAKQIRYRHPGLSSEAYFSHPLRVSAMSMLFEASCEASIGILGLLHNVLEVSEVSSESLARKFGEEISSQILALTVDRSMQWDIGYKTAYYANLMAGPRNARVVKIMDKLDNIFLLGVNPDNNVRKKYLNEIEVFLMPMVKHTTPQLMDYMNELLLNHREKYESGN
jgi:(p)ppGpp synthase/HD superfamily hydrolase